jgi:hypothetical protein
MLKEEDHNDYCRTEKELITKWEKETRVSDLAVQYGFYGICLTFQAVVSLHYNFSFCFG